MNKIEAETSQQGLTPPLNAAIIAALFEVEAKEKKTARRVVAVQLVVTLLGAGIAYGLKSTPQLALAVLGGGAVSVLNGALLAWRMVRAALHPDLDAHHQLRLMYFYAAERFLVVVVLLGLCLAVWKLAPLALLGGFVLGQAALLLARLFTSSFKVSR